MEEDSTIDEEENKDKEDHDIIKFSDVQEKVDSTDLDDHEDE